MHVSGHSTMSPWTLHHPDADAGLSFVSLVVSIFPYDTDQCYKPFSSLEFCDRKYVLVKMVCRNFIAVCTTKHNVYNEPFPRMCICRPC